MDDNIFTSIMKMLPKETPIGVAFAVASKTMPEDEVSGLLSVVMMAIGKDAHNDKEVQEVLSMSIEDVVMSFARRNVADESVIEFMGGDLETGTRPIMDMLGYITASAHKDLTVKEAFDLVEKMQKREIPENARDFFSKMITSSTGGSGGYSSLADTPIGEVRNMTRAAHGGKKQEEEEPAVVEEAPSTPLPDNVVLFPGTKV